MCKVERIVEEEVQKEATYLRELLISAGIDADSEKAKREIELALGNYKKWRSDCAHFNYSLAQKQFPGAIIESPEACGHPGFTGELILKALKIKYLL